MSSDSTKFDCVEMKRRGAERIYRETRDLTLEQEIEFWRQKSAQFRREQQRIAEARSRKKAS